MKLNKIVIASMAVLALAACNKQKQGEMPVGTDGTYAQLTFKEVTDRTPVLKAVNENQQDAAGTDKESKVTSAYFLTSDFTGNQTMSELSGFTAAGAEENKAYTSEKFLYAGTTGTVNSGLVVNGSNLSQANLQAGQLITLDATSAPKKTMDQYTTADKFVMSSLSNVSIDIKDAVAKGAVADGNNRFRYTVERVSAKLQVSAPDAGITVNEFTAKQNNTVKYKGAVESVRYALAGGAMKSYLFGDQAGKRELSGTDNPFTYDGFTSAIHNNTATTGSGASIQWRKDIQKVSDLVLHTHHTDASFATLNSLPIENAASKLNVSDANGIFFLENSIAGSTLMMHDIAHAKVYATFKFADEQKVYTLNYEGDVVEGNKSEVEAERDDEVSVTDEWVNGLKAEKKTQLENENKLTGTAGNYKLKITIAANSFFVGETTGKVYVTLSAARVDGNAATKLYKNGKMFWEVPANKQLAANSDKTGYADTRRNNIYSLQVKSISGIGDNWDNSDPKDPNVPKPDPEDNPDEPEKPEPKPVDPIENYIQVEAKILKWNLVSRSVDLK